MPSDNPKIANLLVGAIDSAASAPTITWGGDAFQSSGTGIYGTASSLKLCISGSDILSISSSALSITGNLRVSGNVGVGNSATATTPGTVVKKIEVFNASGVSLGFLAVYDAIV